MVASPDCCIPWHHRASRELEVKTAPFPSFLPTPAPRRGVPWVGSPPLLLHRRGEHLKHRQDKLSKASSPPDLDILYA